MREINYRSGWVRLRGRHLSGIGPALADATGRRPCVVLATAATCERPESLRTFAAAFTAAGCDVLAADVRAGHELRDLRAAVAAARTLGGVLPDRVVVWGAGSTAAAAVRAAEAPGVTAALALVGSGAEGSPGRAAVTSPCPVLLQVESRDAVAIHGAGWPADAQVATYTVAADDPLGVAALAAIVRDQVTFLERHLGHEGDPLRELAAS